MNDVFESHLSISLTVEVSKEKLFRMIYVKKIFALQLIKTPYFGLQQQKLIIKSQ